MMDININAISIIIFLFYYNIKIIKYKLIIEIIVLIELIEKIKNPLKSIKIYRSTLKSICITAFRFTEGITTVRYKII